MFDEYTPPKISRSYENKKWVSAAMPLGEEIGSKCLLSTKDPRYLHKIPLIDPLEHIKYPLGEPLTRMKIPFKEKRSLIKPGKMSSKLNDYITLKIKSQHMVQKI